MKKKVSDFNCFLFRKRKERYILEENKILASTFDNFLFLKRLSLSIREQIILILRTLDCTTTTVKQSQLICTEVEGSGTGSNYRLDKKANSPN